jgi:hypothetical protein
MRCRQAKRLLFDYIDGVISEADRVGLERHLGECTACEANAASLTSSLDLLHRLPIESPSENFNWKLRLRLARERSAWHDPAETERAWQRRWSVRFTAGVVTGFTAIVVGGFALLSYDDRVDVDGSGHLAALPKVSSPEMSLQRNPAPAGGAQVEGPWTQPPFSLPPASQIVSQPVATGAAQALQPDTRGSGPLINADSLRVRFLESRLEARRIRQLEQQIDVLREELEKCKQGRSE